MSNEAKKLVVSVGFGGEILPFVIGSIISNYRHPYQTNRITESNKDVFRCSRVLCDV